MLCIDVPWRVYTDSKKHGINNKNTESLNFVSGILSIFAPQISVIMKRIFFVLIFGLLALSACQKKGTNLFRGDYSFKTSGSVTLDEIVAEGDTIEPASYVVALPNKIGQLEISALGNEKDSLLVVMNIMGGEVIVTHAYCEGQNIILKDFKNNSLNISIDGNINLSSEMTVKANGTMYDENTLILNMTYDGVAGMSNKNYDLYGDNINLVATRN